VIFKPRMVESILEGCKTVTRRPAKWEPDGEEGGRISPCRYEVGKAYALQPGRGKKAVGRILVTRVSQEIIACIDDAEADLEGFKNRAAFIRYWEGLYGNFDATQLVHRIEFELVGEGRSG
jgi:hypothetical protein